MLFLMQGIPYFLVLLIISTYSLGSKKFSFNITFSGALVVKKSRHYCNDFSLSRILTFISTFIYLSAMNNYCTPTAEHSLVV